MKGLAAGIGVFVLSPFLLAGTAMLMATSSEAAQTISSSLACAGDVDTDTVVEQVTKILNGASGKSVHVEGLSLPEEQIPNARTIVATGIGLHVPKKGQIIALATAMQESRLRNLSSGDLDSLGLFQQRPSQGWGTAAEIRDPVYASEQFYKHLLAVDGWQQLTVTQAAQRVQRSAYPDAYADWEELATALQKAIAATFPDAGQDTSETGTASSTESCAATEDGSGYGSIPEGSVPKSYSIPTNADPTARKAIVWALKQLGTMYQWGGTCTAPHGTDPMGRCDCSSLVQQAYKHAGITLTRTTYTQINEGKAVSTKHLQPGDLIFARGSAARPEHVGMYIGSGLAIEAPRTGKPVRITPLADWHILAARRVI
ncbi:C40 family peptidase [Streptomyces prunicolor]|uniref:C40 family peptidase n=1 Tax=Streptomyces prunicolor TaxID=67348 RepID=UPI00225C281A|nr:C40 family peptidase [Streptomyces prunicolor]MCX5238900.1 C40 family peptidase [Streptomyces prunicolor]